MTEADHLFRQWWQLCIVEQRPIHRVPFAWLLFLASMHTQNRLDPL